MALNFPTSPSLNDTYTLGAKTWTFNGTAWDLTSSKVGYTGSAGTGGGGSLTITDDGSTNSSYYPALSNTAYVGSWSSAYTSTSKLYFNPSTGTLSATTFTSLSDAGEKINVIPVVNALATISKLQGVEFTWKDGSGSSAGLIAQDLEIVLPHLVTTNSEGIKNINYDALIAYLIEAIKELSKE